MKRLVALVTLLALATGLLAFDTRPEPVFPDGTKIQLVLPAKRHMQNVGGSDGAGLCVYTSVTLSADWQNLPEMKSLRKFAEGRPGGSYPEKLDADLKTYAQRYNVTLPNYVQHTGGDDAFLDLLIATRRMPGITYAGQDDFYDSPILHMVNLVHLDATHGAIQDNNRAGRWTSDTRQKILYRWKGLDDHGKDLLVPVRQGLRTLWVPAGGGWAFAWLGPPPPPRPAGIAEEPEPRGDIHRCGYWERHIVDDVAVWVYWCNGHSVGAFRDGKWFIVWIAEDGSVTLVAEKPAPPGLSPPTAEPTDDWNKGVESWKFDRRNRYWVNGVEVSQAKAYAIAADPAGLVDDSDKYHFSVVGEDRSRIVKLFAPGGPLEPYARRVHVQVFSKDAWPVEYLANTVTLQEPAKIGGKVVAVAGDAGEASLKKLLASVFDPPPPVKPDPPKPVDPTPAPAPDPKPVEPKKMPDWVYALLGFLALLFLRK